MWRKPALIMAIALTLFLVLVTSSATWSVQRQTPSRLPEDLITPASLWDSEKSAAFCEISHDTDIPGFFYDNFRPDSVQGFAVYMDPALCGESPYPFRITDVHLYFYEADTTYHWPVTIRVNIKSSAQGYNCSGPQDLLHYEEFIVPEDSAWPVMKTLVLTDPYCVSQPFFLEIVYTEPRDPAHPHPSLLMNTTDDPTDTCDNWGVFQGQYIEWEDFWTPPPPGDAIIRVTGYTEAPECEDLWYWKPDKPDQDFPAPSGMPDFDQNQDEWDGYCGPVAVANCLWWFGAVPPGWTPPQLVDTLARYFHTHPPFYTFVDSMQIGLRQYLQDYGFAYQESTFEMPNFYEMEDSLKKCQDIILLLGFWYYDGENWFREGGHFVTMSGVCSESLKIAVSDPDNDGAVGGWPGRVRPPSHPQPGGYDDTLHNDPEFVSHDMYTSTLEPAFPSPGNPFWEIDYPWARGKFTGMNVPKEFLSVSRPAPEGGKLPFVTEVEYAVMICPKPSGVENEEGAPTPRYFELDQNYPNPFNNETIIKFNLKRSVEATLTVYNILGQRVRTLVAGRTKAGQQFIRWDGKDERGNDLSSGIYFYQLKAGDQTETRRLVLLK